MLNERVWSDRILYRAYRCSVILIGSFWAPFMHHSHLYMIVQKRYRESVSPGTPLAGRRERTPLSWPWLMECSVYIHSTLFSYEPRSGRDPLVLLWVRLHPDLGK